MINAMQDTFSINMIDIFFVDSYIVIVDEKLSRSWGYFPRAESTFFN